MSTSTNVIRRYSRRGYPLRVSLSLWLCNIATSLYHIVSELNKNGIRLRNSTNLLRGWAVASPLRIFRRPGRCVSKANGKQRHTGQGGYAPCRRRLPASRKHEMRRLSASSRGDTCQPDLRPPPRPARMDTHWASATSALGSATSSPSFCFCEGVSGER